MPFSLGNHLPRTYNFTSAILCSHRFSHLISWQFLAFLAFLLPVGMRQTTSVLIGPSHKDGEQWVARRNYLLPNSRSRLDQLQHEAAIKAGGLSSPQQCQYSSHETGNSHRQCVNTRGIPTCLSRQAASIQQASAKSTFCIRSERWKSNHLCEFKSAM